MRGLSKTFMTILKSGFLEPILDLVIRDSTLCLEIRDNYVNIYYRGGNILKIEQRHDSFTAFFDREYLNDDSTRIPILPDLLASSDDVERWIDAIPFLKHEMDLWLGKHPKNERESQQLMLRENNFGNSAKGTDYFICDIEYANLDRRFDLIAVHWPSSAAQRKNNRNLPLAFIEMKYLDNALSETAGLRKHIDDTCKFLEDPHNLANLKDEMKMVFNQKLDFCLIDNEKPIESFSSDNPEYILALANHDPDSSILKRELNTLTHCPHLELKSATSNFMGYGLYDQNIYTLDVFMRRFEDQI